MTFFPHDSWTSTMYLIIMIMIQKYSTEVYNLHEMIFMNNLRKNENNHFIFLKSNSQEKIF